MGKGSYVHQCLGRVGLFLIFFLLEFDLLMINVCKFIKKRKEKRKKKQKKQTN